MRLKLLSKVVGWVNEFTSCARLGQKHLLGARFLDQPNFAFRETRRELNRIKLTILLICTAEEGLVQFDRDGRHLYLRSLLVTLTESKAALSEQDLVDSTIFQLRCQLIHVQIAVHRFFRSVSDLLLPAKHLVAGIHEGWRRGELFLF